MLSIIALRTRNNELEPITCELIGKASRFYNEEISIILPVGTSDYSNLIKELELAGANKIFIIKNDNLEIYNTNNYKQAILQALGQISPDILLIGATTNGRDLAPRISAHLQTGLTADCTELSLNEEGKLAATRPTFGGSLMATILSRKTPQMATVRQGVFKKPQNNNENKAEIQEICVNIDKDSNIQEIDFISKTIENSSLEDAEIIIAAGKGIKTPENFELLKEWANLIGAKVAVSRGLVDAGFATNNIQVGQTGKTVTPKIYIACGISGAIQHIEGMKNSQTIISVNKDENAPILAISDYYIIGDLTELLPQLIENSKRKNNEG